MGSSGDRGGSRNESSQITRQDAAYLKLRDLIVTGELAPGSTIIETQLAEQMELSRSVVRAALRRLELEGYVESVKLNRYSRTVVAPLTEESVVELFPIMGALEGLAARAAAELQEERRVQIADEMQDLNDALLEASRPRPDVVRAQDLHVQFHQVTPQAAAGPILYAQIDTIRHQVERYERLYTHVLMSGIEESVDEHKPIIEAIRKGDADGSQQATQINWRRGADRYREALSNSGGRGRV